MIERLQREGQWGEANITSIDGVRVDYPKGWGLIRASNTTPVPVSYTHLDVYKRQLLEHQRQLQWITRLREACERGHFELFFQPVLALQNAAAGLHYEVLLRYHDPHSGEWISPVQFLDAAARYDFLGAIDRWVIQHPVSYTHLDVYKRQGMHRYLHRGGGDLPPGQAHQAAGQRVGAAVDIAHLPDQAGVLDVLALDGQAEHGAR